MWWRGQVAECSGIEEADALKVGTERRVGPKVGDEHGIRVIVADCAFADGGAGVYIDEIVNADAGG